MAKQPEWLKEVADGYEVTLAKPTKIMGTEVTVMKMREPLIADQEVTASMDGSSATREIHEFANLCGVAPDDIRAMTLKNYQRLQAAYLAFLA